MSREPAITPLTMDAELRVAIGVHTAVHSDPEPIWEEFLYRHPHWSASGAHRAVVEDDRTVARTSLAMWEQRFGTATLSGAGRCNHCCRIGLTTIRTGVTR